MCYKRVAVGALAFCASVGMAGPVLSQSIDRSGYQLYVGQSESYRGSNLTTLYSDLNPGQDGYGAFPDTAIQADGAPEVAGIADYSSIANNSIVLDQFVFIGGIAQASGMVFFDFFDSSGAFVDGFGVTLSQAGNFSWSVNLNTALNISSEGFVRMSIDDENLAGTGSAAAGRWFLGNDGATIGDAGNAESGANFNYTFALNSSVPTPGSLVLLGLGGCVAARRRR